MKKYISLEHTIKKVVAEQNYKKPVDEAISPVDYDKPKEIPQAFFKPVHIQPRKGEAQIPVSGPVRSRRNVEKEKSSETMHPDIKEEENLSFNPNARTLTIPLKDKDKDKDQSSGTSTDTNRKVGQYVDAAKTILKDPVLGTIATMTGVAGITKSAVKLFAKSRAKQLGGKLAAAGAGAAAGLAAGSNDVSSPTSLPNNVKLGDKPPRVISKAKARIHHEEAEIDRKLISNVGRPNEKRDEIVGRPDSPRSKYTKQAEIVRKIIEDKKLIIKSNKEKNLGKNPLVDTEPNLKRVELDQGSEK
jgi:hypothetical protein